MAIVRCKDTTRFGGFTAGLVTILHAVVTVAADLITPAEVLITSGSDGQHLPHSRHYTFEALDLRTHNFPTEAAILAFAQALRARLGAGFTVLLEDPHKPNAHLHCQVRRTWHPAIHA